MYWLCIWKFCLCPFYVFFFFCNSMAFLHCNINVQPKNAVFLTYLDTTLVRAEVARVAEQLPVTGRLVVPPLNSLVLGQDTSPTLPSVSQSLVYELVWVFGGGHQRTLAAMFLSVCLLSPGMNDFPGQIVTLQQSRAEKAFCSLGHHANAAFC